MEKVYRGINRSLIVNEETGFLIEPNHPEELTQKLRKLILNESLRIEMGQKGFERVNNNFSVKNYVSSFEALFNNL